MGSASINSPVQFRNLSKNNVFDRVSPSSAPHSMKKPVSCEKISFFENPLPLDRHAFSRYLLRGSNGNVLYYFC